jgi:hypothetical protein
LQVLVPSPRALAYPVEVDVALQHFVLGDAVRALRYAHEDRGLVRKVRVEVGAHDVRLDSGAGRVTGHEGR